jgi:hypothetical protein
MRSSVRWLAVCAVLAAAPAGAASFTFASFTFEQDYTPDVLGLLGNGATLGGAGFSAGNVTNITQSTAFVASSVVSGVISPQPGFNPALTLGRQGYTQQGLVQTTSPPDCHYGCAINMPNGNLGTTVRHGIAVSWSSGGGLLNGSGNDFVIYESASGSDIASREAYMVRVELAGGGFSGWRYEFVDAFELYLSQSPNGATATAFDLSDFGVLNGGSIVSIQIANLIAADRVDGAGAGNVNFGGVGNTPLSSAGGAAFASGARDPDPLYVGILGTVAVVPVPGAVWLLASGLGALGWLRRKALAR